MSSWLVISFDEIYLLLTFKIVRRNVRCFVDGSAILILHIQ